MNYPVWYLPETGGGLLIALIAILHVYVSHFAVGGGLYLIFAEMKGLRENSRDILDFTRRHARFFLLVTMVFGSITGVGIWFIIALVHPAATSTLIHNFVFGWAAEWVFFVVEIVAAFVYFYMFGRMDSGTHLRVGWLYFIAAWMSLFLINGIIGMMLTPGEWVESRNFWVGFFNPSFFPSLVFRTALSVMLAGCYGYLSASFVKDEWLRRDMTMFSARWGLLAFVVAIPSGWWYLQVLPPEPLALVLGKSPTVAWLLPWMVGGALVTLAVLLVAGILLPQFCSWPVAVLVMIGALCCFGGFEWIREAVRRPYVINEVMYSNAILKSEADSFGDASFLDRARFVTEKSVTPENRSDAGREIFINQCAICHTLNGANNDLVALTAKMSYRAMDSYLARIHKVRYFMPPFIGNEVERGALAAFLTGTLHGKEVGGYQTGIQPAAELSPSAAGAQVFEANCAACHGADELDGATADLDTNGLEEMLATLNEISDEMEPFSGSDAERDQLVAYFLSRHAGPTAGQPVNEESTEDAPAAVPMPVGSVIFEDNCSACHFPEPLQVALRKSTADEIGVTLLKLDEISDEMEPFDGSEAERKALADFLAGEKEAAKAAE